MKIESIEVYHVSMPIKEPWRTAYGEDKVIESVMVCMRSGDYYGWGEGSPLRSPNYSSEWAGGVFMVTRDWLAPSLVGKDIVSGDQLQNMLSWVKGNYIAKASLDLAWWDLQARSKERPLWDLIGGEEPEIEVGADVGILSTFEALFERIEQAKADGFKRVKLKYGMGWDLPMLSAVRERFPEVVFHIDCNSAYKLSDLPMFQEIDCYDLAMIEQPLAHDDLVDHATLQSNIKTALCLDESIISVDKARKAIEIGACRWINIKLGRVGGLTNALAIHDMCKGAGVPCWVGGMLESAIGQSHNIAMATLSNIKYPSDIFPSSRFYVEDITHSDIVLSGPSKIKATDQPGIGCEPAPDRLNQRMIQMARVD